MLLFIFIRRHLIARTMSTSAVIKHFNVIKNIASGFLPCYVDPFLYQLTFEKLEKTFGNGVIMTVATSTHTTFQTM